MVRLYKDFVRLVFAYYQVIFLRRDYTAHNMNEKYFVSMQMEKPVSFEPGLTAKRPSSYAEYGDIFMAEEEVKKGNISDIQPSTGEVENQIVNEDELRIAQSLTDKEISEKQNQAEAGWRIWIDQNKSELHSGDEVLFEALKKHGVSHEQFAANPEYYRNYRVLFESKLDPKEIIRLMHVWKKFFEKTDSGKAEFQQKWHFIATLAIAAGLSPKAFSRKFKWNSYFDIEPPQSLPGIIKQIVKDIIVDIVAGVAMPVDDPQKTPGENKIIRERRKEAFAKALWGAVNDKQEKDGKPINVDEKHTQDKLAELGVVPAVLSEVRRKAKRTEVIDPTVVFTNTTLSDTDRIKEAESLLGVDLTKEQEAALLRAHAYGAEQAGKDGKEAVVFNYTPEQIAEKVRILNTFFTREQRRMLMETGLAGVGDENEEDSGVDRNNEKRKKEAEDILKNLTRSQLQVIEDIRVALLNRNIPLDIDHPSIAIDAAKLAQDIPEGTRINSEQIDQFVYRKLSEMNQIVNEVRHERLVSIQEQQAAKRLWDEFSKGRELTDEEKQRIERWVAQGKTPQQAVWEHAPAESREELIERATRAWQQYEAIRNDQEQPITEVERFSINEAIKRGEMPPIDYVHPEEPDYNESPLEDESAAGNRTMWEQLQDLYKQYKIQKNKVLRPGERKTTLDDIARAEQYIFEHPVPNSVEDLAWLIGKSAPEMFGVMSNNPVWEVVYKIDGPGYKVGDRVTDEDDLYDENKTEGRVNKGNFMLWLRERMAYMHGDEPDDGINFEQEITIERGGFGTIHMGNIRKNPGRYLRRESISRKKRELEEKLRKTSGDEKEEIKKQINELPSVVMIDLLDEIKRETWAFTMTRNYDLNYRARSGNKEDFTKMMIEIFARSPFTKTVWDGRSLFDWVFTMDQEYGKDDHKVGAAIVGAYLVYYNLTDTEKLKELMGDKASVLLTREGLKEARDDAAGINWGSDGKARVTQKFNVNGEMVNRIVEKNSEEVDAIRKGMMSDTAIDNLFYFNQEEMDKIKEIYRDIARRGFPVPQRTFVEAGVDEKGKSRWKEVDKDQQEIINEWRYIKAFNFNSSPQIPAEPSLIVRAAIKKFLAEKYDLKVKDNETGEMLNDGNSVDFAELFANTMNRWTGAQARNNHSAAGYDAWVALMKTRAYRRKYSESNRSEAFGNPYTVDMIRSLIPDLMTGIRTETRITEVDREKNEKYAQRSDKAFKAPIEVLEEMAKAWDTAMPEDRAKKYADASRQHKYLSNSLKYFGLDQIKRGMDIYNQIIDAQEIKLEKFTRIDPLKGITFERDQFQAAVQDKFLKPMRYMLSTWSQVDLGMTVRESRGDEAETGWTDITIAEKMFGKEVLDVPEFWEKVSEGTPGARKFSTRNKEGVFHDTWRIPHKISGKEVNDNRVQLIKQVAKTRIAAELYSHVDLHSSDPRYDFRFYETIISALEKLPGGIEGDEYDLKSAKTILDPNRRYFSKEDIDWIRKKSKTTRGRLFGFELLRVLFVEMLLKGTAEGVKKSGQFVVKGL